MASRMASAALGEMPKALSFAPARTWNASPRRRSSVSGPTNGIVEGRLSTRGVKRGVLVMAVYSQRGGCRKAPYSLTHRDIQPHPRRLVNSV